MTGRWLWALAVVLAGCSDPDGGAPEERCPPSTGAVDRVENALEIGFWGEDDFEPVSPGQMVPFVQGFQGGYMVTPLVRIDRTRFDSDGICAVMDIEAYVSAGPYQKLHYEFANPRSDGEYWLTDTIPLFLSGIPEPLEGKPCTLTATWRDDDLEATSSVEVQLYFDEHR
jgi:hypothetical protein